jgi:peptidoglycan hydrolase CwlO-like protein
MQQGKRRDQIEFSYKVCAIAIVLIVITMIGLGVWRWTASPTAPIETEQWIPTEEDIIWIDSLHNQVKDIEQDVNELNVSVTRIDRKLDDMIEEQKEEDAIYNDEYQIWITNEGDTIYE